MSNSKPIVIDVCGNIAAGKTTYLELLKKHFETTGLRVTIVWEPVDEWEKSGILARFYEDQKRWGYTFQTKAYHDRIMRNVKVFNERRYDTDVFLLERSWFSDTLFMNLLHKDGKIDDLEMAMYKEWCSMWLSLAPYTPSMFLYLRTEAKECYRRKLERARGAECGVTLEYLTALQDQHDTFLLNGDPGVGGGVEVPVTVVELDFDYRNDNSLKEKVVNQFENLLLQLRQ